MRQLTKEILVKQNKQFKCKRLLHDFHIVFENERVLVERCSFCGKKVVYRLKGNHEPVDGMFYYKMHIRDFLQDSGNWKYLYRRINGTIFQKGKDSWINDQRVKAKNESYLHKISNYLETII